LSTFGQFFALWVMGRNPLDQRRVLFVALVAGTRTEILVRLAKAQGEIPIKAA
jgi:hypothetical protein